MTMSSCMRGIVRNSLVRVIFFLQMRQVLKYIGIPIMIQKDVGDQYQ